MSGLSINCPWCKKYVSLVWLGLISSIHGEYVTENLSKPLFYSTQNQHWSLGKCPSCNNCVLLKLENNTTSCYPYPMPTPTDERIPEEIKKDLNEAKLCFSVNAFRACASMCRRAIQQACIKEGANKSKDLEKQIDELKDKGIITEQIRKWAHSCRYLGNDASHPENPDVTKEDAEDVLSLAEQLMNILYVMPAISEKVNKIHEKKKEKI